MRFRAILVAAAIAAVLPSAACSSGKSGLSADTANRSSSSSKEDHDYPLSDEAMKARFTSIDEAAEGPLLKLSDVTAAPGETARVTLSVSGAANNWSVCGLHITYPDVIEPDMLDPENHEVKYTKGDASKNATAAVSKTWVDNYPQELIDTHKGCLFFTEIFNGNSGGDGEIVSFDFKIPENAESGTVYDIGMYFLETDMFINTDKDYSFEKYAFEHFSGGSITVK